ncbi:hypothetical protein CCMSSC00406_0006395 [Pleurotus cornucopiae]|uniref:Uncharacterized protein n=1 Tax=Pleurotus cornucopiae TaxID=5321 RepID=A0ACB7IQT3_PLECO|nr:hypothetical protein CCMSSC00406_0006395 [Pleurotus cornucopiae]
MPRIGNGDGEKGGPGWKTKGRLVETRHARRYTKNQAVGDNDDKPWRWRTLDRSTPTQSYNPPLPHFPLVLRPACRCATIVVKAAAFALWIYGVRRTVGSRRNGDSAHCSCESLGAPVDSALRGSGSGKGQADTSKGQRVHSQLRSGSSRVASALNLPHSALSGQSFHFAGLTGTLALGSRANPVRILGGYRTRIGGVDSLSSSEVIPRTFPFTTDAPNGQATPGGSANPWPTLQR